ncbi:hypothetical protein ABZP36_034877 [Zizania latifolia]
MSSATATGTETEFGGAWLGELSAALQGTWQAMVSAGGDQRRRMGEAGEKKGVAAGGESRTRRTKQEGEVVACGGAISDTTLCLLLDRFAPS